MKVEKASEVGFCFGVRRAIDLVENAVRERGAVDCLGALVHNRVVVDRLAALGVRVVASLDEARGDTVVITSHGVGPQVMAEIKARGLRVLDATCPFVRRAQRTAEGLARDGFFSVIFGDAGHPEVQGLLGWAGDIGVATVDAAEASLLAKGRRPIGILSQTTRSPDHFDRFVEQVGALLADTSPRCINTICPPTRRRDAAARSLAKMVDLMVVVGGRDSANTRRLAEVSAAAGVATCHIETAAELNHLWLRGHNCVGVTAGASTPDEVIDEVVLRLEQMAPI